MMTARTQHIANMQPNNFYSLNAHICYVHHAPKMTTAIIEEQGVQYRMKISESLNNIRYKIQAEANYHFGLCYLTPNGWISVKNPDNSIHPNDDQHQKIQPTNLSDIIINFQTLNKKYLSTILYVVKVNETKQIQKDNEIKKLCILNCFAQGYLIDISIWNSDIPLEYLCNNWVLFSGFRVKKFLNSKFNLASSVYSEKKIQEQEPKSTSYIQYTQYHNLSHIYQPRTISEIIMIPPSNYKYYSQIQALIMKPTSHTYQVCSTCKKIIGDEPCSCSLNSGFKISNYVKVNLVGSKLNSDISCCFQ